MNIQKILIGAALVVVLTLGVIFPRGNSVVNQLVTGAATGPDSYFPCETHDGVQTCFVRQTMKVGTTTLCAMQSPNATSTLRLATAKWSVSSTTATLVVIAKSTTAYATTTALDAEVAIGANGTASVFASTTQATGSTRLIAPSTFITVGMRGNSGTFSPVGSCNAVFDVI